MSEPQARKVILYISMSLDGYIAGPNESLDFLSRMEVPGEDYGYFSFTDSVDTVIWGRKTYDKVKSLVEELPHQDKALYVISRTRTGTEGHAQYHNDVIQLIHTLRESPGKHIYCDGGGGIVFELLRHRMIDQLIVSVIPHLLGSGTPLFREGRPEQQLTLKSCITYPSGLVQLSYLPT